MDVKTRALRLSVRGALLMAALAGAVLVINLPWFDEALHPELEALLTPRAVSMDDNAYPLIYGFTAADRIEPAVAGRAIVEELRARHRSGEPIGLSDEEMAEMLGGTDLDAGWRADLESLDCNTRMALDCADLLIAEVARGEHRHARLGVLLDRYAAILRAPRFEENQEFDTSTPIPPYGLLMAVGKVRLAASFAHDSTPQFLAKLEEDFAFWRRMLRDGESLIAKMVALAGLRNDLDFLASLMRNRDLADDELEALADFVRPLTSDEGDIGDAFVAELRIMLQSDKPLVVMVGETSLFTRLTLQRNATLNEFYLAVTVPLRLRGSLGARELQEQDDGRLTYAVRAFPPPLYNLGGKLVLKQWVEQYDMTDYVLRVHDLNGRIALVLLQAELERGGDVETVIRSSSHREPYTLAPMVYDAHTRTIGFECRSNPNDVCAVAIGPSGH